MSSTVEQIKAKLGIVELVSSYIKLEKAGVNWKARCPFHNEKTPSFFVSPARQSYHCFGCNRGGDIISFVEEIEGLDFLATLKLLAERAGVTLEPLKNQKETSEKESLHRVLEAARDFYVAELQSARPVRDYLKSRGLTEETIKNFSLGFAPDGWQNLCQFLSDRRFSEEVIIKAGLAVRSSKSSGIYDRFRSRIMFPINDATGRVVGFSGRIFGPESEQTGGKYVNSPETLLYNKSKILYGYDRAKLAIRRADKCLIVEGQMDLLLSHQAGFQNTVAVSGTALTAEHLNLIRRLTDNLVMAFDGDAAGVSATSRSIALALEQNLNVRLVSLPANEDPASLILKDKNLWTKAVDEAKLVIDFWLDYLSEQKLEKLELIHQIEKIIYPYLSLLTNNHDRDHYVTKISFLTQLPENGIREKLRLLLSRAGFVLSQNKVKTDEVKITRQVKILDKLFGLWWRGEELEDRLREVLGEQFLEQKKLLEEKKSELTLAAELAYADMARDKLDKEIGDLLNNLQLDLCDAEVDKLRFKLSQAEINKDEVSATQVLSELNILYKKISDLKNKK